MNFIRHRQLNVLSLGLLFTLNVGAYAIVCGPKEEPIKDEEGEVIDCKTKAQPTSQNSATQGNSAAGEEKPNKDNGPTTAGNSSSTDNQENPSTGSQQTSNPSTDAVSREFSRGVIRDNFIRDNKGNILGFEGDPVAVEAAINANIQNWMHRNGPTDPGGRHQGSGDFGVDMTTQNVAVSVVDADVMKEAALAAGLPEKGFVYNRQVNKDGSTTFNIIAWPAGEEGNQIKQKAQELLNKRELEFRKLAIAPAAKETVATKQNLTFGTNAQSDKQLIVMNTSRDSKVVEGAKAKEEKADEKAKDLKPPFDLKTKNPMDAVVDAYRLGEQNGYEKGLLAGKGRQIASLSDLGATSSFKVPAQVIAAGSDDIANRIGAAGLEHRSPVMRGLSSIKQYTHSKRTLLPVLALLALVGVWMVYRGIRGKTVTRKPLLGFARRQKASKKSKASKTVIDASQTFVKKAKR